MIKQLQKLGLSLVQAKIYLSILKARRTTVLIISRDTGIQRPTIYENIHALEQNMLVSYIIDKGKKFIQANNPENLNLMIKQKQTVVSDILPELEALFSATEKNEPTVRFFHGQKSLEKLANVILSSKEKTIWTLADYDRNINKPFSKKYLHELWKSRDRKHIFGKILFTHASLPALKNNKDFSVVANVRYNREVRILPESIELSVLYTIVDDNVLFWGPKEEDVSFQFISSSYAKSLKSLFEYLWSVSEKI